VYICKKKRKKDNMEKFIRHGDMIIVRASKEEIAGKQAVKKDKSLTVGIGEVSGHSHLIRPLKKADGTVPSIFEYGDTKEVLVSEDVYSDNDGVLFEIRGGNAVITHEEHGPIILEEGIYKRWFQVVYNPYVKQLQKVRD
jgi:hypothetical protein